MDEGDTETVKKKKGYQCSKCKRLIKGHLRPYRSNCEHEELSKEDTEKRNIFLIQDESWKSQGKRCPAHI